MVNSGTGEDNLPPSSSHELSLEDLENLAGGIGPPSDSPGRSDAEEEASEELSGIPDAGDISADGGDGKTEGPAVKPVPPPSDRPPPSRTTVGGKPRRADIPLNR